jgi:hypothetical protein
MNGLSWLLYFAEVSENISTTLGAMAIITAIASIIVTLFVVIPDSHDKTNTWELQGPKLQKGLIVMFFVSLLGLLFPSQNTVYLIMASESAQAVATSDAGQKMIGDIQNIVSLKLQTIADDMTAEAQQSIRGKN